MKNVWLVLFSEQQVYVYDIVFSPQHLQQLFIKAAVTARHLLYFVTPKCKPIYNQDNKQLWHSCCENALKFLDRHDYFVNFSSDGKILFILCEGSDYKETYRVFSVKRGNITSDVIQMQIFFYSLLKQKRSVIMRNQNPVNGFRMHGGKWF